MKTWLFVFLALVLPSDFERVTDSRQEVPGLVPGTTVTEHQMSWRNSQGAHLHAFYWKPYPPRPGGPLVAEEEWDDKFCGLDVKVVSASQFLGSSTPALVTHLRLSQPECVIMLYSRDLDRQTFHDILSKARWEGEMTPLQ